MTMRMKIPKPSRRDLEAANLIMSAIRNRIVEDFGPINKLKAGELDMLDEIYFDELFGDDEEDGDEIQIPTIEEMMREYARKYHEEMTREKERRAREKGKQ